MSGRVALVTGASSGIGQSTARLVAERGFAVFGTSREPSTVTPIPGVEMLRLDVRSDESVAGCVDAALRQAGRLDVLVNNAGYELAGAIEETSLEEAKAQFEANFFGVVRMVKAALPAMRSQRSGLIVNVSSLTTLLPLPFLGFYAASKSALESYTEALRHEVWPFGIRVSLVQPGSIRTKLLENRQVPEQPFADYAPFRDRVLSTLRRFEDKGADPDVVARCILRIVQSRSPSLRYRVPRQAVLVAAGRRLLPEGLFQWALRRYFGLDGSA